MSIEAIALTKSFGTPSVQVLSPLTFSVRNGEFLSITGRSGCGKSTLLYLLSTLDTPTSGRVKIDGVDIATLSEKALHDFRNRRMGFVFQFHYLLPEIDVLENVLMPARRTGERASREARARHLLAEFALGDKGDRLPSELSGGERQRVAIARALVMEPRYIFADEPTGNLDSSNGETVLKILEAAARVGGATVVFVTHDRDYAARADRQLKMLDGKIVEIVDQRDAIAFRGARA